MVSGTVCFVSVLKHTVIYFRWCAQHVCADRLIQLPFVSLHRINVIIMQARAVAGRKFVSGNSEFAAGRGQQSTRHTSRGCTKIWHVNGEKNTRVRARNARKN